MGPSRVVAWSRAAARSGSDDSDVLIGAMAVEAGVRQAGYDRRYPVNRPHRQTEFTEFSEFSEFTGGRS
jgi:hypothetical protein